MKTRCPHCHNETVWAENNPFRPFCSERCQLIDLGAWADGKRAIPSDHISTDEEPDESPALPPQGPEEQE